MRRPLETGLYPGVSVGSTVRYVRGSYGVDSGTIGLTTDEWLRDASDLERQAQNKVDLDIGLKLGGARFQAAIVARNLLQPTFETPDGSSVRMDSQVRAGVAFRPVEALLLAGDIDLSRYATASGFRRNLAVGGEFWFGLWLAIRAGARVNLEDASSHARPVGALGFSLALSEGIYVDAQLSRGRDEVEQGWRVSLLASASSASALHTIVQAATTAARASCLPTCRRGTLAVAGRPIGSGRPR